MNEPLTAAVRGILQKPYAQEWTVQGFGFIRCYLDRAKRWRLNVWDNDLASNASLIHDHPWRFTSYVVAGVLLNYRYTEDQALGEWYSWTLLVPGIGGGLAPDVPQGLSCLFTPDRGESYFPGQTYTQEHREVHRTEFADGTVTLNDRQRMGKDVARIFWPAGEKWKDAMPRDATATEIRRTVDKAMAQLGSST